MIKYDTLKYRMFLMKKVVSKCPFVFSKYLYKYNCYGLPKIEFIGVIHCPIFNYGMPKIGLSTFIPYPNLVFLGLI